MELNQGRCLMSKQRRSLMLEYMHLVTMRDPVAGAELARLNADHVRTEQQWLADGVEV